MSFDIIWAKQFPNTTQEDMNAPSLDWIISEIVVDTIFKNTELEKYMVTKPVCKYLYEEKINNENLMTVVNNIYKKSSSIKQFQNEMLQLFKNINHHQFIR